MTITAATPPPHPDREGAAGATVTSAPAPTGVSRLHPVDGLFLRAQHLDRIQEYAGTLNRLSCLAGGSGTVYGFELDLHVDASGKRKRNRRAKRVPRRAARLRAAPGLAVSGEGRLLRSLTSLEVDLGALEVGVARRFWVVEAVPAATTLSGSEPAYTSVCATSCGPGSSIHPWEDETVALRVRAETLDGWDDAAPRSRSALASELFERERTRGDPWLTPRSPQGAVARLMDRQWSRPAPEQAPDAAAVPLGVLLRREGTWVLDTWAARRDREAPPPQPAWLGRASMRPWSTFVAQVLQFQEQLTGLERDHGGPVELAEHFVELPPGGFLDSAYLEGVRAASVRGSRLRIIRCTADVAISAVALAQRLDRIPLTGDGWPAIDVWVPDIPADLPALRTEDYGWIAFTRGVQVGDEERPGPVRPDVASREDTDDTDDTDDTAVASGAVVADSSVDEARVEEVDVFVMAAPRNRTAYAATVERATDVDPRGVVRFASGEWEPMGSEIIRDLRSEIADGTRVDVVVTTPEGGSEPLAVGRGSTLARELGLWKDNDGGVFAVCSERSAIYLMRRP